MLIISHLQDNRGAIYVHFFGDEVYSDRGTVKGWEHVFGVGVGQRRFPHPRHNCF